ncbi:MAG: hypothetical protein J4O02_05545, partial [Chloroflexi bacterium]|nr:hypothetical protein [Chloroflexota bacterium]
TGQYRMRPSFPTASGAQSFPLWWLFASFPRGVWKASILRPDSRPLDDMVFFETPNKKTTLSGGLNAFSSAFRLYYGRGDWI